jgi:integrase
MKKRQLTKMSMPRGETPRWRKVYKHKRYYFTGPYDEAFTKWEMKKEELDKEESPDRLVRIAAHGFEYDGDDIYETIAVDFAPESDGVAYPTDVRPIADHAVKLVEEAAGTLIDTRRPGREKTISEVATMFLERSKVKMAADEISVGYYATLIRCINHFTSFVDVRLALNNLTALRLEDYRTELSRRMKTGWTASYTAAYGRCVRTFLRWAYDTELLRSLPRNIRILSIAVPLQKLVDFSNDEITTLLENASERMRLYLLLMMNTGCTQKDVSDLRPDEIDWRNGRVSRKRSKTKGCENVPEVEYLLWKPTFDLLKRLGARQGDKALVNEDGGALKIEKLRNDKVVKIDNIATAYNRLTTKLKTQELLRTIKPIKTIRKTSHSRIANNKDFTHFATHFLGHSARTVADRNYLVIDQSKFDEAVTWLGRQYGIE